MSWSRWVSCLAISAGLASLSCKATPDVQVLGETTRLERSRPSPKESAFYDGSVVSLRAARGETLGLTVRISDEKIRAIRLELPDVARVTSFRVGWLRVREPSTRMYGASRGPGLYPDVLTPVTPPVESADLAHFDVAVPTTALPGRYLGRLEIDGEARLVVLDVDRAVIELGKNPLVWAFYLPSSIAQVHGLADDDGPALIEREAEYHDLMRAHGVLLAADLGPDRFAPRARFVRDTRYWPVAVDTSSDGAIARDTRAWLSIFQGSGVTPFAIPVDEPKTASERERARHIAEEIGRAGGGRPRLLRAVTDAFDPVYDGVMDVFISPKNVPAVARARRGRGERFWTYNGRPPEAGSMILDTDGAALRSWGWIAQRYDVELWYAWEALYFSDRYNDGSRNDVLADPVTFDQRSSGGGDFGNGDGVLAYPGPLPSLRLKALRRGLLDRLLLQKLEACGGGAQARRIAQRMIPRALAEAKEPFSWSTREVVWERARKEVLDAIEVACHEDEELAR